MPITGHFAYTQRFFLRFLKVGNAFSAKNLKKKNGNGKCWYPSPFWLVVAHKSIGTAATVTQQLSE
jgi:hypothetical protein